MSWETLYRYIQKMGGSRTDFHQQFVEVFSNNIGMDARVDPNCPLALIAFFLALLLTVQTQINKKVGGV